MNYADFSLVFCEKMEMTKKHLPLGQVLDLMNVNFE